MTQSTEQERAEFEKAWRERPIYMGGVHQKEVAYIWWMQAARRAPAAPLQMPEPFTTLVRKKSWSTNCYEASPLSNHRDYGRLWADERVNVYTEQQVRQLLAAHGIQGQST